MMTVKKTTTMLWSLPVVDAKDTRLEKMSREGDVVGSPPAKSSRYDSQRLHHWRMR